jgi:hypothetical protein
MCSPRCCRAQNNGKPRSAASARRATESDDWEAGCCGSVSEFSPVRSHQSGRRRRRCASSPPARVLRSASYFFCFDCSDYSMFCELWEESHSSVQRNWIEEFQLFPSIIKNKSPARFVQLERSFQTYSVPSSSSGVRLRFVWILKPHLV